ncbi:MAG TPA: SRPBCC family protein [Myxococcota bacterium]|jgi:ribosome-associated toxin RatA of RatAB toxin-antitoxin module
MPRNLARLALALLLTIGLPKVAAGDSLPPDEPAPADRFAPLAPPALGDADRARLGAGEVLIRDLEPSAPDGIGVLLMGLVDATPDQVWEVMQDCEKQDEFLPRISHAAVQDREGDSHTCDLVVDLPLPLGDLRTETRHQVRRLPDGGHQRRWDLLPGDWSYLRNSGSWTVHPYSGGGRSLLIGRMDLLPKAVIPTWVMRAAQVRQAPETFAAIRARVRQVLSRAPTSG